MLARGDHVGCVEVNWVVRVSMHAIVCGQNQKHEAWWREVVRARSRREAVERVVLVLRQTGGGNQTGTRARAGVALECRLGHFGQVEADG